MPKRVAKKRCDGCLKAGVGEGPRPLVAVKCGVSCMAGFNSFIAIVCLCMVKQAAFALPWFYRLRSEVTAYTVTLGKTGFTKSGMVPHFNEPIA